MTGTGRGAEVGPDGGQGGEEAGASTERTVRKLDLESGRDRRVREEVVDEFPLTLLVNGREMATLVCSPTHLEELALGFLTAEGILDPATLDEVRLTVVREDGVAVVEAPGGSAERARDEFGKRWVGSCCGKSRTGFYLANDARTAEAVTGEPVLDARDCAGLMEELHGASPLFGRTGGVHNAGLAMPGGGLGPVRTDVGRHNTLDKLYGLALREGLDLSERVVVFSGRISSEIVLKVSKMGCPVLLSKSAPTDLALSLAEDLNVTAVGFLRRGQMNVYTHPRRISLAATAASSTNDASSPGASRE